MRSPFVELLAALKRAFDHAGLRWYLFGAQAALLYGVERLTADVDATVFLGDRATTELVDALRRAGFQMRVQDDAFIERTRVLPVRHAASGIAADVVLAGPGIEELFLYRAELHDLDGVKVPVARPEDIIVMKILAGRPKDQEDILAILTVREDTLDLELIRETLRLLEDALDQRDLLPELERSLARARRS
jgi:hypothetical protein